MGRRTAREKQHRRPSHPLRVRIAAALAALAAAAALPSAAAAAGPPAPAPATGTPVSPSPGAEAEAVGGPVPGTERALSDERVNTWWAHPVDAATIYAHPNLHSHRVARIRMETEDGFPEVYLLLRTRVDAAGVEWVRLRIPGRPNGRTGWVNREALGEFELTHWRIEINREQRRLRAWYRDRLRFTAPVGVGKPSTPTPAGHFWIRERFTVSEPGNPYYPYALGTSDYSTLSEWPGGGVVGIHGPFGQPELIPGDPSHGCIRMHVSDIKWLGPRVSLGTPVLID